MSMASSPRVRPAPIAVVLAAGAGTRFRRAGVGHKQAARLPNGRMLLSQVCSIFADEGLVVVCALPAALSGLAESLAREGHRPIFIEAAHRGMGYTLARTIRQSDSPGGWLVVPGDMPSIRAGTVRAVAQALVGGAELCAPVFERQRGHPVGFGPRFRRHLEALDGDSGARGLLQEFSDDLVLLDVDDPGVLIDIDTLEDLERLRGS